MQDLKEISIKLGGDYCPRGCILEIKKQRMRCFGGNGRMIVGEVGGDVVFNLADLPADRVKELGGKVPADCPMVLTLVI